jgi:hypothetical protein
MSLNWQVSIQPCTPAGVLIGTAALNLEVISFDETRKAKLRTYSRAQAYSDTSLIIGAYNKEFTMTIALPQQFTLDGGGIPQYGGEDIESLLDALRYQDQWLIDANGIGRQVRVTNISDVHTGGQPYYYTMDISMIAVNNYEHPVIPIITNLSIIGTTTNTFAIHDGYQRKAFYAQGLWWAFWYTGTTVVFSTSSNRTTWAATTTVETFPISGFGLAVWFDGTYVYYISVGSGSNGIRWKRGTPTVGGTITWTATQTIAFTNNTSVPMTITDSAGASWLDCSSNGGGSIVSKNAHSDGTWLNGTPANYEPTGLSNVCRLVIVPLLSGKVGVVYTYLNGSVICMNVQVWNGASWNSPISPTANVITDAPSFTAVSIGDIIHVAFLTGTPYNIVYAQYDAASNTLVSEQVLLATNDANARPTISKDSTGRIYVFYPVSATSTIKYLMRFTTGVWSSVQSFQPVVGAFPSDNRIEATWDDTGGYIQVLFLALLSGPTYRVWSGFLSTT